jgi:signal peptidase I
MSPGARPIRDVQDPLGAPPAGAGEAAPATAAARAPRPARRLRARLGAASAGAGKLALGALFAYGLMFNFSVVRGSSMSPSIHDGDRILVDHLSYLFQSVRRGDIVVLQYPLNPEVDYIKRVIGLPGDEVVIERGRVQVNGRVLAEPYVASRDRDSRLEVRVLPDHFFVLGDNRPHSSDSREFGLVHKSLLRGRVNLRVWPIGRAGTID